MTAFRKLEKAKREAQEQANRDHAPFCVVQFGDVVYVRRPSRARNLCLKHLDEASILARVEPQEA